MALGHWDILPESKLKNKLHKHKALDILRFTLILNLGVLFLMDVKNFNNRIMVVIDYSNYHYYLKKAKWKIDWYVFKKYFENLYLESSFYYYEGIPSISQLKDLHKGMLDDEARAEQKKKRDWFKYLKSWGYAVEAKPVNRVYDKPAKRYRHKCNFDVEITIDVLDRIETFDVLILCSGDGDFEKLIKNVKGKGKGVIIIGPSFDKTNMNIEKAAHSVLYLSMLKNDIERKPKL